MSDPDPTPAPVLRVLRGGEPTAEEIAALVAVLIVRAGAGSPPAPRSLRRPLTPWVASGLINGTRTKV
jgi:hypothetical protein